MASELSNLIDKELERVEGGNRRDEHTARLASLRIKTPSPRKNASFAQRVWTKKTVALAVMGALGFAMILFLVFTRKSATSSPSQGFAEGDTQDFSEELRDAKIPPSNFVPAKDFSLTESPPALPEPPPAAEASDEAAKAPPNATMVAVAPLLAVPAPSPAPLRPASTSLAPAPLISVPAPAPQPSSKARALPPSEVPRVAPAPAPPAG
ncbi:hypothetical protein WJX73_004920 [Symbiochloris irregularis]|uniref:Uncharacterized protein n=1 Tax=Symbiochloris irregularis TaxID=706552 RepID=A0AAW1NMB8_9CHLO